VYDKIAEHFSNTRYKAWPRIEKFLMELEPGSLVLDVGCGNGKYIGVNQKNLLTIGTDRSKGLLDTALEKD
jgi:ubiquinone/menaquinone biosynthesis C-methylase UbiE